jgi:hypothetical protein
MKEKIFLKKNSRNGKSPSSPSSFFQIRNLLKFGIILLFWIAFIPLLWHQKTKNADDKSTNAKVVKEIPKSSVPASNVDSGAPPKETAPAPSPFSEKPIAPQSGDKAEAPAATGGSVIPPREPLAARSEDESKPPIGPVPDIRTGTPATATPTGARGAAGEASVDRPAARTQQPSPDKSKPGGTTLSTDKSKPGGNAIPGEKHKTGEDAASVGKMKPGATGVPSDKPKPAATTGTGVSPTASKPATTKEQQPQSATTLTKETPQKPPTTAAPADRTKTPATTASKPPGPGAPSTTPNTPPAPAADKTKEPSGGVNWVYILRLGTFQNSTQAQELQKKLQQKGYAVAVKSSQNLQKGKVYHVDLKGMRDAAQAKAQLDKLQKEEQVTPVLLKVAETH